MDQSLGLAKPSLMESAAEDIPAKCVLSRQLNKLSESSLATKTSFRREWMDALLAGFVAYYLTSLPVLLGLLFGAEYLRPRGGSISIPINDPVAACVHFGAIHYLDIIQHGYSYNPDDASLVAYFPAYPLLCRWIGQALGLSPIEAALVVANLAFLGAFVLLARYVRVRWPEATVGQCALILSVFGLWPLGLFFRMPYAESLFVFGTLAVLYGMARDWPLTVLALLTGLVTAVRPVGVALIATFVWHVLTKTRCSLLSKVGQALLLSPPACWGLLTYMGYQWLTFGEPWAFAQTQQHWTFLAPEGQSWSAKFWSLATLEPIWGVYVPNYPRFWGNTYWGSVDGAGSPMFSLIFWNPALFVLSGVLLLLGGMKRWLNGGELLLGVGLLSIPYLTRSYEMSMASHGRFAAVVVVNYLVLGRMMVRLSPLAVSAACAALTMFLFLFTSLYAANYLIF